MLQYKAYIWRCVLGGEIVTLLCYLYGKTLADPLRILHDQFWAMFPGGSMSGAAGFVTVVVTVAIMSAIVGAYVVWMHNASFAKK